YPREAPLPERLAPDSTAPSVASSAVDIPTNSDAERRAWQTRSSVPPAAPRSGGFDRAGQQSGQRWWRVRREMHQRLISLTGASGQYTNVPSRGYPLKRSNSGHQHPATLPLFRAPGIAAGLGRRGVVHYRPTTRP